MRTRVTTFALALLLAVAASPAGAQNREHQQLTADIRMLEEQLSRVLLANNQQAEQLKATNKRLDDLYDSNVKQFANQKVLIDQAVATLGNVREKLQDGDLRVQQLSQEMTPIRDGIQKLTSVVNTLVALLQPPSTSPAPEVAGTPGPAQPGGTGPLAPVTIGPSAGGIYTQAFNDYQKGQYESAIEGFREVIRTYPDAPDAAEAQFEIGQSLYQQGKFKDAIQEYQKLLTAYAKTSARLSEAHLMQGLCYSALGQKAQAQQKYETVIKQFPNTIEALQASQKLDAMGVKH